MVEIGGRQKGEGAELLVHDYGVGLSEDAQRRIFEGYFTTRDYQVLKAKMLDEGQRHLPDNLVGEPLADRNFDLLPFAL